MANLIDLTGQTFGLWTVLEYSHKDHRSQHRWLCECSCEAKTQRKVIGNTLRDGRSTSCGCKTKHGHALKGNISITYKAWKGMMSRCHITKDTSYPYYGGRGITVCERWHNFENFLADMEEKPEGYTLERYDHNSSYRPDNVRWALPHEQRYNTRRSFLITYRNETKCLGEWIKLLTKEGKPPLVGSCGIINRLKKGWSFEQALYTPSLRPGR